RCTELPDHGGPLDRQAFPASAAQAPVGHPPRGWRGRAARLAGTGRRDAAAPPGPALAGPSSSLSALRQEDRGQRTEDRGQKQQVAPLSSVFCLLSFVFCPLSSVLCPLSSGKPLLHSVRDACEDLGPMARLLLAEEAHAGIPGTILPVQQPTPVRGKGQRHP